MLGIISRWHSCPALLLHHTTAILFFVVTTHAAGLPLQENLSVASCLLQIKLPTPGVDSPALEEDEKAPYQVLLKFMKACLSTTRENRPEAFEVAYALFKAAADAKWL